MSFNLSSHHCAKKSYPASITKIETQEMKHKKVVANIKIIDIVKQEINNSEGKGCLLSGL